MALNSTTVITLNHEDEEEEDLVLDFSSGQAEVVENTATQVEVVSEEKVAKAGGKAFTKFRELSKTVGIEKEIEDAGNVTIFSPRNRDFDKLTTGLSICLNLTILFINFNHQNQGFKKKRAREMSRSDKVSRTFEFLCIFVSAEKIQAKV